MIMTIFHCSMCDSPIKIRYRLCDLCMEVIMDLKFNYNMDEIYKRARQRLMRKEKNALNG